jgi:poly-gamma-glutamate synthesis protein (capsule biosynthesis protein)
MIKSNGTILITGDFCPVNRTSSLITVGGERPLFNDFLAFTKDKDISVTNLECPLTETEAEIDKYGPAMKASANVARILSAAGFNLVTLANNHIMDYGIKGLKSTLKACEANNMNYVGVGDSQTEARKIFYARAGSFNVAILNFAENEFSTTQGRYPGANPLDPINNYGDILEAKTNADYVIVIVHGGNELFNLPSPRIKKTFHFFAEAGASAIFLHHAHCYSGYEIYKGTPIFYGLGNFIFDKPLKRNQPWNYGYAVELNLTGNLIFNIIPYDQCGKNIGITLLNDKEKQLFNYNIERLNSIIMDDEKLSMEFEKYCKRVKKVYFSHIEPHSIKLLHSLRNRKLLPSLLSKKKKTLYLNLMRCESHRDVLINLLDSREGLHPEN